MLMGGIFFELLLAGEKIQRKVRKEAEGRKDCWNTNQH
jgi:hypothetical protein